MRRLRCADMRLVASLFGVMVLAACGGSAVNPVPPSTPVSQQAATPCRVPFTDFKTAGFISYPKGSYTADPSAAIVPDPDRPAFAHTVVSPVLTGVAGNGARHTTGDSHAGFQRLTNWSPLMVPSTRTAR